MLTVDYRHSLFQGRNDDEDEDDDQSIDLGESLSSPTSTLPSSSSSSSRTSRGLSNSCSSLTMMNHHDGNEHKKGGNLKSFLQKTNSLRLNRRGLAPKNNKHNSHKNNDEGGEDSSISCSESMSSSNSSSGWGSLSMLSWGNTSVTGDLTMSISSFAASVSSFHDSIRKQGSSKGELFKMESEANVKKLLSQLQDRIDSRQEKKTQMQERIDNCLALACARFETGSNTQAIMVLLRKLHRLRDMLARIEQVQAQLQELHEKLQQELEEARFAANNKSEGSLGDEFFASLGKNRSSSSLGRNSGSSSSGAILVDVDLEDIRQQARKVEREANERPTPEMKSESALLEEFTTQFLSPDKQRELRRRRKQTRKRQKSMSNKPAPSPPPQPPSMLGQRQPEQVEPEQLQHDGGIIDEQPQEQLLPKVNELQSRKAVDPILLVAQKNELQPKNAAQPKKSLEAAPVQQKPHLEKQHHQPHKLNTPTKTTVRKKPIVEEHYFL